MTTSAAEASCSSDSTCGPLKKSLEAGSLDPARDTFSYCSADENAFLGPSLAKCQTCLSNTNTEKYLSNCTCLKCFLVFLTMLADFSHL